MATKYCLINPQTFRRFFGLIKNGGNFRKHTLDTFAQYCGFTDYSSFLKCGLENELDLFFLETTTHHSDYDYWQMSEIICKKISESPTHLTKVHHQLIKYPQARIFFMEHHPMRDLAGTVYAQYFQEYLKYENSNEAKLFAYGFLYMGAFLTENRSFMQIYFQKILETELTPDVYVLPAARKFGVELLHYWFNKDYKRFAKTYSKMLLAKEHYKKISEKSVCSFEYSVLEHLIFTDKTEEMRYLIENNTSQLFNDNEFVRQDRKENHEECWKIMSALAYFKMRDYELAEKNLITINLAKLSIGWKKYYSILFYLVKFHFVDMEEKSTIIERISLLISETHFDYFYNNLAEISAEFEFNKDKVVS